MTQFIWKYKQTDPEDIKQISQVFNLPASIATIMSLK